MTFADYYDQWIDLNKVGQIATVTLHKYRMTAQKLREIDSATLVADVTRVKLQQIFNEYAKTRHRTTVSDFMNQVFPAVEDAYDEGLIERLPLRKFVNNGHTKKREKHKFLNQGELTSLIKQLEFGDKITYDYFILLLIKTGLRYSEALALTPEDIDLENRTLTVNKTLDYKNWDSDELRFKKTKTTTSNRTIVLDWHFVNVFQGVLSRIPPQTLIFKNLVGINGNIHNSTANTFLERACKRAEIPIISVHSLRHTHASILIAEGVSMMSVSKRLGHASTEVTQRVYIHLTQELEAKDTHTVVKALSGIF